MPISINGTTGISGVDGSAGTPALQGTDTNTGIAFGSDVIICSTGGTERFRCDSSGRLLVGTSTAYGSAVLQAVGYAGSPANTGYVSIVHGGNAGSGEDVGLLEFRDTRGAFGSIKLAVDGTTGTNDYPGRLVFSTTADGASSPTERCRISNLGKFYARAASTDVAFFSTGSGAAAGDSFISCRHSSTTVTDGTEVFRVRTTGDVQNTNNSYGAISDIKLKENIVDATPQWSDIKALQVRKYNFKEGQTHTQIGLVAQEVELVSPGLVSESPDRDEDGNDLGTVTKSVNYSVLYMKAVKALQEAMERIEQLETSNADLLARVTALESA